MMKQCPNCKGALDNNGKCLACGTVTRLDLSDEDGKVLNEVPNELLKILEPIPSRAENIFRELNRLTYEAEYEDEKLGHKSDLKFELGAEIINELRLEYMHYLNTDGFNPRIKQKASIMGIPVDINYDEPNMIKLWKEVEV